MELKIFNEWILHSDCEHPGNNQFCKFADGIKCFHCGESNPAVYDLALLAEIEFLDYKRKWEVVKTLVTPSGAKRSLL